MRHDALACPACGARRIRYGTRFCDQCGKRVPDSVVRKLDRERSIEPGKQGRHFKQSSTAGESSPPLELSDRADQSVPVPSLGDTSAIGDLGTVQLRQGMRQTGADGRPSMAWGTQMVFGVSLVAFGVAIALASAVTGTSSLAGFGLASFLIGLLLVFLRSRPTFPPEFVEAFVISSLVNVERVLRELVPETKAVYLKINDRLDVPMVFLPLEENRAPPSELTLSDGDHFLLIDSADLHKTGLLLQAPGASLLALMEKESGVDFMDLGEQDFLDALRSGMVESLEVVADVSGVVGEDCVKFRIRDGALGGLSRSVARLAPNVASRIGCPICSVVICGTVKVVKRDMILEEATHQRGYHMVTLRFARGPTNDTS